MKLENIEIGMKVVPFKSSNRIILTEKQFTKLIKEKDRRTESHWSFFSMVRDGYCIVNRINYDNKTVTLGRSDRTGGQSYNIDDFNPLQKTEGKQILLF